MKRFFTCALAALMSVFFSMGASAQIFKCETEKGVEFSDEPCLKNGKGTSEIISVDEATKPSGMSLSNPEMEALGAEMHTERRQNELDRAIEKQQKKIDKILDKYNKDRTNLEDKLAKHRDSADYDKWRNHPYKREQYYEKERQIKNDLLEVRRKFKVDREKAYNKLSQLRRERSSVR